MPQRAGLYRFYAIDHDFSAFFPDIKRDGVCPAYRGGIEIEIHGNQKSLAPITVSPVDAVRSL